ncbi:MAG: hypothetical protein JKY65_21385 [Planctomycetes bacterium]|nr:hypothetical protein [Planctomycetota bacterium]
MTNLFERSKVWLAPGFEWLPAELDDLLAAFEIDTLHANRFVTLRGVRLYVKLRHIRPGASLTKPHRGGWWGGAPFRKREFDSLLYLQSAGIDAVRPVAAAARYCGGLLSQELLASVALEGTRDLRYLLPESTPERAGELCSLAGAAVGRMHEAGFRHRDLFPRNLLALGEGQGTRMVLLDCRKGGQSWRPFRVFAYDLACFDKWSGVLYRPAARRRFFAAYLATRGLTARSARPLLRQVAARRAALVARFVYGKRREHKQHRLSPRPAEMPAIRWEDLDQGRSVATHPDSGPLEFAPPAAGLNPQAS